MASNTADMIDNSAPRNGRYAALALNPNNAKIGSPQAAHPLLINPNAEPNEAKRLDFPNERISVTLLNISARFAPVSMAIIISIVNPNPLIAVHIPPNKAISSLTL